MEYEFLIERARMFAQSNVCICDSRSLNQMADAMENQQKHIEALQKRLEMAQGERDIVTERMIQLEQKLAALNGGSDGQY